MRLLECVGGRQTVKQFLFAPRAVRMPQYLIRAACAMLALCVAERSSLAQRDGQPFVDLPFVKLRPLSLDLKLRKEEVAADFEIRYTTDKIFNPSRNEFDEVELRSYKVLNPLQGPLKPQPPAFVAPALEIFPGQTLRITLKNTLRDEPHCEPKNEEHVNVPHCFNTTNLHTHGLWVSPAGNSDNVMIAIKPGVTFQYEYNIPADHPAGTFWYHPHRHGSTAVQVSSGMAGALIVRGERLPTLAKNGDPEKNGDIDSLLKLVSPAVEERVFLLQQIAYACRDSQGEFTWDCKGRTGKIEIEKEDFFQKYFGDAGVEGWENSGRYTTVNGLVRVKYETAPGKVERWRVIHAGMRAVVKLTFRKGDENVLKNLDETFKTFMPISGPYAKRIIDAEEKIIDTACPGNKNHPQFALASDGLTRSKIVEKDMTVLQPGYREDLLMVFLEPGTYCIIDEAAGPDETVGSGVKSRKLLGRVIVAPALVRPDLDRVPIIPGRGAKEHLTASLVAAADKLPTDIRQVVREDLEKGLLLTRFVPHKSLEHRAYTSGKDITFQLLNGIPSINDEQYKPSVFDPDFVVELDKVEQRSIISRSGKHPFHIHVNPFQIAKIFKNTNPDQDLSETGETGDPQYANMKWAWRDTIFVKSGYTVVIRTEYRRYIGDFVLHCHNLHHEDLGMMRNFRIEVPKTKGGHH